MTAAVPATGLRPGLLLSMAAFPCKPDLIERGLRDGVEGEAIRIMAKRGELLTLGRHVVDMEAFLSGRRTRQVGL